MQITRTNSGQLVMVGPARELDAVQKLLADAGHADCNEDAHQAIWQYQRDGLCTLTTRRNAGIVLRKATF